MLRNIMKPKCKGNSLEIDLSNWGYSNYIAECVYYFDKCKEKYSLSIYLKRKDIEAKMKLSSKKIDTQYISGTKETIIENICRIVHEASISGYFNHYIQRYEYELACFERGNELFEQERLGVNNV